MEKVKNLYMYNGKNITESKMKELFKLGEFYNYNPNTITLVEKITCDKNPDCIKGISTITWYNDSTDTYIDFCCDNAKKKFTS